MKNGGSSERHIPEISSWTRRKKASSNKYIQQLQEETNE
jgi:hypothetical protein